MKMSELFKDEFGFPFSWSDEQVRAATKAINNHDALVEALEDARHMLWAAKCNMHTDGTSESLEIAVKSTRTDIRELDKLIEKFKGES